MADYRGGDNAGLSPHAAEAVKNINSGNTPGARHRELVQRAALAASQAFLMGGAGVVKRAQSQHDENLKKQDSLNDEKLRAFRTQQEQNTYAGVPMAGSKESAGMRRVDDQGSGPDAYPMARVPNMSVEDMGRYGVAQDDVNKAAASAPVTWGGKDYHTPSGLDDMSQNSAIQGQDIYRARNIMDANSAPSYGTPGDIMGGMDQSRRVQ